MKTLISGSLLWLVFLATVTHAQNLPVVWDTLRLAGGFAFTIANNGNAGNSGVGSVNLDYVGSQEDCTIVDPSPADVYLNDLTPIIMQSQSNYSWQPFWSEARATARDFQPVVSADTSAYNERSWYAKYRTERFLSSDSRIGCTKHWILIPWYDHPFVAERWEVFSVDGTDLENVALAALVDWNIPSDTGNLNLGAIDMAADYAWLAGVEQHSDQDGDCLAADRRLGYSGMLGYYFVSELASDWRVNHTGMAGLKIISKGELFSPVDSLYSDSVWNRLQEPGAEVSITDPDQVMLMNYGTFDIPVGDTLVIWTVHGSVRDGDLTDIESNLVDIRDWYTYSRDDIVRFSCCGLYTGGYPGNTNCSTDGNINLADITRLIDLVYISKQELCCNENANTNSDQGGKTGLADIVKLIDHVYISKAPLPPCL